MTIISSKRTFVSAVILAVTCFGSAQSAGNISSCSGLEKAALPHATITKVSIENLETGTACRVLVTSKPTGRSDIGIEVWIPTGAAWNGKYVQAGNGGYAGRISSDQLRSLALKGYVAAGTDNGHQSPLTDGSWALGNPEKFADFGWRSLKETTEVSKVLIKKSKGAGPKRSYFWGCSDGGREGLMEAQRFPKDFDGVVAGAPGNYMARLMTMRVGYYQVVRRPGGYLDAPQLQLIQRAVLSQCGGTDAGFVRDPTQCQFDPGPLLCKKEGGAGECLTEPQLASIRAIYKGWTDPRTGQSLFPGYEPGAEAQRGWKQTILGDNEASLDTSASGYLFASSYVRFFVKADPTYDISNFDMGGEAVSGVEKTAPIIDSENPDLSAFKSHGGKLLQYHGWNDQNIPARSSLRYFNAVQTTMGNSSNFYRLFMVPGMLHCSGGASPSSVDWLATLDRWAETGVAPENVVASEGRVTAATEAPHPVHSQLLCPYPKKAALVGQDSSDASNYRCSGST